MNEKLVNQAYEIAKERYANIGVDTDKVLETMQDFHLSLHCWQADDVTGFEKLGSDLTGGIQVTGNYPGKARNIDNSDRIFSRQNHLYLVLIDLTFMKSMAISKISAWIEMK